MATLTLTGNNNTIQAVPKSSYTATVEGLESEDPAPSSPIVVNWSDIVGKPTFGTASSRDVPAAGNANTAQVVLGSDSRLTDTRDTTVAQITDATATGKDLLLAPGSTQARAVLGSTSVGDALFTAPDALSGRNTLGLGTASVLNSPIPVANGGTAATTAANARTNLGLGTAAVLNSPIPVANGGTAATSVAGARTNLGSGAFGDSMFLAATSSAAVQLLDDALPVVGQCRLDYVSTSQIKLSREDGYYLFVNGQYCTIPAAGVTVGPSGTVGTLMHAYAVATAGAISSLELSATVPVIDTTYGNRIKTGDPTRAYVGTVYINTGTQFIQTAVANGVVSWFNPRLRGLQSVLTGTIPTASLTPVAITGIATIGTGRRSVSAAWTGTNQQTAAGNVTFSGIGLNSTATNFAPTGYFQAYAAGGYGSASTTGCFDLAFNTYYTLYALGWVNAGTASFITGAGISALVEY